MVTRQCTRCGSNAGSSDVSCPVCFSALDPVGQINNPLTTGDRENRFSFPQAPERTAGSRSSGPQVYRAGGARQNHRAGNNIVLVVVLVLMLALIAGVGIYSSTHRNAAHLTAREVVEKLMTAEAKRDWGTTYDLMDWPPSMKQEMEAQGGRRWFERNAKQYMDTANIGITEYRIDSVVENGDSAIAITHARAMVAGKSMEIDEETELKLVDGQWKIKPNLPERLQGQK